MKDFLPVFWWLGAIPAIALVITSLGYSFGNSVVMGVMFLPGMLAARYFIPQLSFADRRQGIIDCLYLISAILALENLCILLAGSYMIELYQDTLPPLLLNPVFQFLMLTAFIFPEMMLEKYIAARYPRKSSISFTSDRRKVVLDPADIACIESNDSEVWIHTFAGESYRTKTRICQWEAQLDERFLRIHRSYIVNTNRIEESSANRIVVNGREIEISRKYKEEVRRRLTTHPDKQPE